jgi:hypothetical protein
VDVAVFCAVCAGLCNEFAGNGAGIGLDTGSNTRILILAKWARFHNQPAQNQQLVHRLK